MPGGLIKNSVVLWPPDLGTYDRKVNFVSIVGVLLAFYLSVTLFAVIMTYREQCITGSQNTMMNALGYGACLFWPLVLIVLIATARRKDFA